MSELVRFEGNDGSFMWVEVSSVHARDSEIELVVDEGDGIKKATTALERSMGSVRGAAAALMATLPEIIDRDDRVELHVVSLEFGLSFGVEGGVIVAKGSARAEATVTLTWSAREQR